MIGILHGYLLEGSGSNLWTRSIIQALCKNGETVHLICQENHPDEYDFISEAYYYDADGQKKQLLKRETPYPGKCIMHKPWIGETLPVYVWDKYEEFRDVRSMTELDDQTIENYLERNVKVVLWIAQEYELKVLHANHAVLMSVVAQRVSEKIGIPFAVMPHGSAIEYAVKKDTRFFNFALQAFSAASLIFVIGQEIRQRVNALFPQIPNLDEKMRTLNLGVDTSLFRLLDRGNRRDSMERLCQMLDASSQGKSTTQSQQLLEELKDNMSLDELKELIKKTSVYDGKQVDQDAPEKLLNIHWEKEPILLFVGRLIASKGIHLVLAALPLILKEQPETRLIIVGHGPLREAMEVFIWALQNGARNLVENIVRWGWELENGPNAPFKEIRFFFDRLKENDALDDYFISAQRFMSRDRVIFTGYLRHKELRFLFPAADTAIFPSVVAEAGPLVFLEALASGCFPIGTYFAGMAASIDSLQEVLPDYALEAMKLSPDEERVVYDIVTKTPQALKLKGKYRQQLRRVAEEKYDWKNISRKYLADLR